MNGVTAVAGIPIPSTAPVFLTIVGIHVLLGLACVVTGLVAMLSRKGRGRHSRFATIYFWCLSGVVATASALAFVRWSEDYPLFILGALSFTAACVGRRAIRQKWPSWAGLHVVGMGGSYILLVTAFYVDNGKSLPLWRELPQFAFWVLPALLGFPIVAYALRAHPVVSAARAAGA